MLRAIFDGTAGKTDPELIRLIGNLLESNVFDGFGKSFVNVDFDTPDFDMLTRLTRDTWHFAAAKNYQMLRDFTEALIGEDGKVRSFGEFKKAASVISDQYNKNWLKTEYNMAIGSSTMASRWNEFISNQKSMPFLKYQTVGDKRVRETHKALDGIARKIDDIFWNTHFPPNGWGCRCDVIQLPGIALETPDDKIPAVYIQEMFRVNLAKKALVYPDGHPYYDGVPVKVLESSLMILPKNAAYKIVYSGTNGSVFMHILHNLKEASDNIITAKILAEAGNKVYLLPVVNLAGSQGDAIREHLYGTKEFISGKNPDALLENRIAELKAPVKVSSDAIHNAIISGKSQADFIIIRLNGELDPELIKRSIKGTLNQTKYVDEVWVITSKKKILKYTRKQLGLPEKAKRST